MVKNPVPLVREACPIKGRVVHPVHEEGEVAGVPLQREGVKAISKSAVRQRVGVREKGVGASKVPRPVYRSENTSRLLANILHYVNFAAERPANRRDIAAEQPQTRPEPLTVRDFDAGFEPSVGKAKMAAGSYAGGSVVAGPIPALKPLRVALAGL